MPEAGGALGHVSWLGWAALATFAVQNGFAVLIMRWSKVRQPEPYSSQVAVFMQEAAVKLPISIILYACECGGPLSALRAISFDLRERSHEWVQLLVPALLYTVQNTLLYVGYANAEAAIGQVTYQSKILWTAVFSVIILGKRLSPSQWLALVVLAAGVIAVQGNADRKTHEQQGSAAATQRPMMGILALVGAAVCTSVASVYFEKMLKGSSKPSLWLRNIQLAAYCSIIAAMALIFSSDPNLSKRGWLAGFGVATWLSVLWQALGGIIVAVSIKYADNILRGFAQAIALVIGAVGSHQLFGFEITPSFCGGTALVAAAVFIYGGSCDGLVGRCSAPCGTRGADEMEDGRGHSEAEPLLCGSGSNGRSEAAHGPPA